MKKSILLAATALATFGLSTAAMADDNQANIRIELSGPNAGGVNNLTVLQSLGDGNRIGTGTDAATAFSVRGPWNDISVSQLGNTNVLRGAVAGSGPAAGNNVSANFVGSNNTQDLNTGLRGTRPTSSSIAINVLSSNNTANDALDANGGSLTLTRFVGLLANNNSFNNDVQALGGSLNINETVLASNNSITRTGTVGGSFDAVALLTGSGNTIDTTLNSSASVTMNQTAGLGADNNQFNSTIGGTGTGTQSVTQTARALSDNNTFTVTLGGSGSGGQTIVQGVSGNGNVLTVTADRNGDGSQNVTQNVGGGLFFYNNNVLTATLTNTGAGNQTLTQSVEPSTRAVSGGFNNNTMTALMTGTNQTVTQDIITTEVNRGNFLQSLGRARSQNNTFNVTTLADNTSIDATWSGSNGLINVTQAGTATGASVNFTGFGSANVGNGTAGSGANVNISQSGAGNTLSLTATANPGQVMTVNSTQN